MIERAYQGADDLGRMLALARQFPQENQHSIDLPYRFSSWALDESLNTRLWFEGEELVGWAVLQTPFWTMDLCCRPERVSDLYPQMLAWLCRRAGEAGSTSYGHPCWFINVFADQAEQQRALAEAEFTDQGDVGEDSWSKVFMERPGALPVKNYRLPEGVIIRPLAGTCEVEGYVALQRTVFESKNMTVDWRKKTLLQPDYQADLDLVAVAPDGQLVAFCIGWLGKLGDGSLHGQIEPLGCHPDFRRYALGRTVLAECLRRLQARGAMSIFVETDSYRNTAFALYESLGFQVVRDVRVYRKDFP